MVSIPFWHKVGGSISLHTASTTEAWLCATDIETQLMGLISGEVAMTHAHLAALSTAGLAISPAIITALQALSPIPQALFVHKLAQSLALQKLIDRAVLARRLLLTGLQVPLIAQNAPARKAIRQAIDQLEQSVNTVLWERRIREQTLASPLQQLLQYQHHQLTHHVMPDTRAPAATLSQGSLKTDH